MKASTVVVGSLDALRGVLATGELIDVTNDTDVVLLPTAAAFLGINEAAIELSVLFEPSGAKVEALMIADRASNAEPYFVRRVTSADLVVLSDGSALHAKSVWRGSPVGEAIRDTRCVVAVGSVASLLGDVMIDPRGGAPTTGLGYRSGLTLGVSASEEQLSRTRSLLGQDETFAVLGPRGVVYFNGTSWHRASDDVVTTRGHDVIEL
ncbi:MAG: type 1 glutamine amidotransferase family protein [Acidimicrobiales bacterium]